MLLLAGCGEGSQGRDGSGSPRVRLPDPKLGTLVYLSLEVRDRISENVLDIYSKELQTLKYEQAYEERNNQDIESLLQRRLQYQPLYRKRFSSCFCPGGFHLGASVFDIKSYLPWICGAPEISTPPQLTAAVIRDHLDSIILTECNFTFGCLKSCLDFIKSIFSPEQELLRRIILEVADFTATMSHGLATTIRRTKAQFYYQP